MADTGLGPLKLYRFYQNNSGGRTVTNDDVARDVFIEAHTYREANALAEAVGIYFDGAGDCPCCGNRWSPQWDESEVFEEKDLEDYTDRRVHRYQDLMRRRYGAS